MEAKRHVDVVEADNAAKFVQFKYSKKFIRF